MEAGGSGGGGGIGGGGGGHIQVCLILEYSIEICPPPSPKKALTFPLLNLAKTRSEE